MRGLWPKHQGPIREVPRRICIAESGVGPQRLCSPSRLPGPAELPRVEAATI
jgi:hypothetical protein